MTTRKTQTISDDRPQLDKFKDAARDLECDDDEQHFRDRLGKLVKPEKDRLEK